MRLLIPEKNLPDPAYRGTEAGLIHHLLAGASETPDEDHSDDM